jgi:hypothetical protein
MWMARRICGWIEGSATLSQSYALNMIGGPMRIYAGSDATQSQPVWDKICGWASGRAI